MAQSLMGKYNINTSIIRAIENLSDKAQSAVLFNGRTGESFRTTVGVWHGCLLSPTLFNIFLERIMCEAFDESMRKDTLEFAKEKYLNGHSDTRSVQQTFDLLTSFIQDSADKHIPLKTSRSVSSIPWITPEIRRKIHRKNKLMQRQKRQAVANLDKNLKL